MSRRIAPHARQPQIPAYSLYGEAYSAPADMLHVEPIQSRSSRYQWEIDAHTHQGLHQLLWVHTGPVEAVLDGVRHTGVGPLAVVIPPGVVHAFRFSNSTDGHVLTFNPRAVLEGDVPATGEALRDLFAASRLLLLDDMPSLATRLSSLFQTLTDEFAAPDAAGSPLPLWLARAIVWRLAQQAARSESASGRAPTNHGLYTRFLLLVETHHRDHWPVSRYAHELGLSVERLNRLTHHEAGRAALELIHERLAREATRRLTYIAAPIAQLALELGFDDPAYFCRFFKRRTGVSPSEFRRRMHMADH